MILRSVQRSLSVVAVSLATASLIVGCDENPQTPVADTTAPAAVTDLRVTGSLVNTVGLTWTAPGNDCGAGAANQFGNGDGTFGTKTDFGTGSNPESVAIGDLNGDGRPDLAVGNSGRRGCGNTVSVLLNLGTTTPVCLSSFTLMHGDNGIEVRWVFSNHAGAPDFRLTGSRGPADQWEIPIDEQAGNAFVTWDRSPQLAAGGVVHYTLLYRNTGTGWVVLTEQTISLDAAPRSTQLLAPYPNPANPRVVIPFVLARAQHVRVTVHDAARTRGGAPRWWRTRCRRGPIGLVGPGRTGPARRVRDVRGAARDARRRAGAEDRGREIGMLGGATPACGRYDTAMAAAPLLEIRRFRWQPCARIRPPRPAIRQLRSSQTLDHCSNCALVSCVGTETMGGNPDANIG